jgi:hypothetical protein
LGFERSETSDGLVGDRELPLEPSDGDRVGGLLHLGEGSLLSVENGGMDQDWCFAIRAP